MVVVDAAAYVAKGSAISDGQAGDGGSENALGMEHAAVGIAVYRQASGPGAEDRHIICDEQFARGQLDGAGDGKIDRVAVCRTGESVAQRAGAAVGGAGYGERGRMSR